MAPTSIDTRQQAHELIDRLAPGQISVVVDLLGIILDPTLRTTAAILPEDEEISEEEERDVTESRRWLQHNEAIPNEEVLAEFGLNTEDFERMANTPLPPESRQTGQ